MDFPFEGPVIEWRGPAPFVFVELGPEVSADVKFAAAGLEYWGQVAVEVEIRAARFSTALFPREGVYLLPLRSAVRESLGITVGDTAVGALSLRPR